MSESVFDILDREADNSDSLEVGSCLHMCIKQSFLAVGVCAVSLHCWRDWIRNGLICTGAARGQVLMKCNSTLVLSVV